MHARDEKYTILIGIPVGKRMDRRETGWEGVDWMHLAQDRDQ
jgi:hypothetical protein